MRTLRNHRFAVVIAVGVFLALGLPQTAVVAAPAESAKRQDGAGLSAEVLPARQRDLGLSLGQARHWLAEAQAAANAAEDLRAWLGADFGGAWLADDGQLVVAVTDPAAADRVRAAGAVPRLVSRSQQQLAAVKAALDRAEPPPSTVTSWYVDLESNQVVVEAQPDGRAAAARFIADSGVSAAAVRIVPASDRPRLLKKPPYPLREGDPYYTSSHRCTIGFLITTAYGADGYVTAGHCGGVGTPTLGFNFKPQGVFRASTFPGRDAAVVTVNADWEPQPRFAGSAEAPVGATVCKIGATTGLTCGTVTAKNQTVNYPQGTVYGLTRTTICAEPGDSGAPVFTTDRQAQGTVSGGAGNCTVGGVTFFQPLNPVLLAWRLSLQTS